MNVYIVIVLSLVPETLEILDFCSSDGKYTGILILLTGSQWWQATWLRKLQESLPLSSCIRMMCVLQLLLYDRVSKHIGS
jgi:hypothetical protein